jgi:hypothetical protein
MSNTPLAAIEEACEPATLRSALNLRHDLDPQLVHEWSEKKVSQRILGGARHRASAEAALSAYQRDLAAGLRHKWPRPPVTLDVLDLLLEQSVHRERTHYAKVRVIELPLDGKRFVLVYGDAVDAEVQGGTGPFDTFVSAVGWFQRGGR